MEGQLVAVEIVNRNSDNPLLRGIVVHKGNVFEITILCYHPWAFEVIRNGTMRSGCWYPESVPSMLTPLQILVWAAQKH